MVRWSWVIILTMKILRKYKKYSINGTSFGPKSTWDELYFLDFAPDGIVDGAIDIYKIEVDVVFSVKFRDEGKAPFTDGF